MKYALDTEFIDTPTATGLLSLALVAQDGRDVYVEFPYNDADLSPWLRENVVPMLGPVKVSFQEAARQIIALVGRDPRPEVWAFYAAHDWYWFCRVFGGLADVPDRFGHFCRDFVYVQQGVPDIYGPKHFALNDARSLLAAMKRRNMV